MHWLTLLTDRPIDWLAEQLVDRLQSRGREDVSEPSGRQIRELIFRPDILLPWGPNSHIFMHHLATASVVYEHVYERAQGKAGGGRGRPGGSRGGRGGRTQAGAAASASAARPPAVRAPWSIAKDELLLLKKMRWVGRLGSRSVGDLVEVPAGELVARRRLGAAASSL